MKNNLKMIFLLTVCALVLAGCGKRKIETDAGIESAAGTEAIQESDTPMTADRKETVEAEPEIEEPETAEPEEQKPEQEGANTEATEPEESPKPKNESSGQKHEAKQQSEPSPVPDTSQQTGQEIPQEPENIQPEKVEEPEQVEPVSYSPQRVAELAVEKTAAQGKIYIPDDLDRMLAAGELSQEDYDACYPTDGAGYLEYYVAADMNEARDISGTIQFSSEADIAANIAGMYAALPQQYFYIAYGGSVMYGDKECHVFYCYRA